MPKYLRLLLLALGLFFSIWLVKHSYNDADSVEADSKLLTNQETDKHHESILSGSQRGQADEREGLLSITDPDKFYDGLVSYFLSQDEATFTPLQQKVYTCQRIFLQIDNGGVSGMLYNADDRSQWCAQVANYCRELQAIASADVFEAISAIFAEMEAQDLSHVKTWGDYLAHANKMSPLEGLMGQLDPYDDMVAPLVDFVFEHREALLTTHEETHSEAPTL